MLVSLVRGGLGYEHTNSELVIDMLRDAEQPRHDRIETFSDRKDEVCVTHRRTILARKLLIFVLAQVVRALRAMGSQEEIREGDQNFQFPTLGKKFSWLTLRFTNSKRAVVMFHYKGFSARGALLADWSHGYLPYLSKLLLTHQNYSV
jgi:arginine utilization protein RocB